MSENTDPATMNDDQLKQAALDANAAIADAQVAHHNNMNALGTTLGAIRQEAERRGVSVA